MYYYSIYKYFELNFLFIFWVFFFHLNNFNTLTSTKKVKKKTFLKGFHLIFIFCYMSDLFQLIKTFLIVLINNNNTGHPYLQFVILSVSSQMW